MTRSYIFGGNNDPINPAATEYSPIVGNGLWVTTASYCKQHFTAAGTIKGMRIKLSETPGNGGSYTFTFYYSGATSALTLTIADGATEGIVYTDVAISGNNTSHGSLKCAPVDSPTAAPTATWYFIFDSTTANETLWANNSHVGTSSTTFGMCNGHGGSFSGTEANMEQIVPCSGTIKNLQVSLSGSPGTGTSYVLVIRKNGADTALTCSVDDAYTTAADTVHSFTVAAGDRVSLGITEVGVATGRYFYWGLTFVPDSPSWAVMSAAYTDVPADEELHDGHGFCLWGATAVGMLTCNCALKAVYTYRGTAPGAGTSVEVYVKKNGTDIAGTNAVVSGTSNSGSATNLTEPIEVSSVLSLRYNTASGSPTHAVGSVGLLFTRMEELLTETVTLTEAKNTRPKKSPIETITLTDAQVDLYTSLGSIRKVGTDTSATGNALSLTFNHTLVSGSNRIVVVCVTVENASTSDITGITYGTVAMTKAKDIIVGSTTTMNGEIWYLLEADLPANGVNSVAVSMSGTSSGTETNGFCAEYVNVTQDVPEATDADSIAASTPLDITSTISPSTGAWVISLLGAGGPGSYAHGESQVEVIDFADASSQLCVAELRNASGETSLTSTFTGTPNRQVRLAVSLKMISLGEFFQAILNEIVEMMENDPVNIMFENFDGADVLTYVNNLASSTVGDDDTTCPLSTPYNAKFYQPIHTANSYYNHGYYDLGGAKTHAYIYAGRVRWDVQPGSGDYYWFMGCGHSSTMSSAGLCYAGVTYNGTAYAWTVRVWTGAALTVYTGTYKAIPENADYTLELYVTNEDSTNNVVKLWVNGVLEINISGINNYNSARELRYVGFGSLWGAADAAVNFYLDDVACGYFKIGTVSGLGALTRANKVATEIATLTDSRNSRDSTIKTDTATLTDSRNSKGIASKVETTTLTDSRNSRGTAVRSDLVRLGGSGKRQLLEGIDWKNPDNWTVWTPGTSFTYDSATDSIKFVGRYNLFLTQFIPIYTDKKYYIKYDVMIKNKVEGSPLYGGTHSYSSASLDAELPGHPGSYDYFGDVGTQFTADTWYTNRINTVISAAPRTLESSITSEYDKWHTGTKQATIMFLPNYSEGSAQETYIRNLEFYEGETDNADNKVSSPKIETSTLTDVLESVYTAGAVLEEAILTETITLTESDIPMVLKIASEIFTMTDSEREWLYAVIANAISIVDARHAKSDSIVKEKIDIDQNVNKSGLVLDLSLDELDGIKTIDESGNKNNGTLVNIYPNDSTLLPLNPSLEGDFIVVNETDENHYIHRPIDWDISYSYDNADVLIAKKETEIVRDSLSAIRVIYEQTNITTETTFNINNGSDRFAVDETKYIEVGCFQYVVRGNTQGDQTLFFYDSEGTYLCRRWGTTTTVDLGDGWYLVRTLFQPSAGDPNLPTDGGSIPYIPQGATTAYFMQYHVWHGTATVQEVIYDKFFGYDWDSEPSTAQSSTRALAGRCSGKYGKGIAFNGSTSSVNLVTDIDTSARTIVAWVNFAILAQTKGANNNIFSGSLYQHSANNYIYFGNNDYFAWAASSDVWYHLAFVTPDKTDDINALLYINGVPYSLNQQTGPHTVSSITGIGGVGGTNAISGFVDEVKVWDRALSAAEIEQLYNSEKDAFVKASTIPDDTITQTDIGSTKLDLTVKEKFDIDQNVNKSGLILDIAFEEGTGIVLNDESGSKNNGILNGGATFANGKYGKGVLLDGIDGYVIVPDSNSLSPADEITVSCWIKYNALENIGLIWKGGYNYILYGPEAGNIRFICWDDVDLASSAIFSDSLITTGLWYHIVGTYSTDAKSRIYLNGILQHTGSANGGILRDQSGNLYIGTRGDLLTFCLDGEMDEVKIWNRALSETEIEQLYNSEKDVVVKVSTTPDEITTLTDIRALLLRAKAISETTTITDSKITHLIGMRNETITLTDSELEKITRFVAEIISLSDSIRSNPIVVKTEIETLIDSMLARVELHTIFSEILTMTDSELDKVSISIADTLNLSDSRKVSATLRAIAETITLADIRYVQARRTHSETMSLTDLGSGKLNLKAITDIMTMTDSKFGTPETELEEKINIEQNINKSGLVLDFSLDESSGNAIDESGNKNHGIVNGAIRVDGKYNGGLQLNGSSDYIGSIGQDSTWSSLGTKTLVAWIYPTSFVGQRMIMGNRSGATIGFGFGTEAITGYLKAWTWDTYFNDKTSSLAPTLNAWNFVAFIHQGTTLTFYLNEQFETQTGVPAPYPGGEGLAIGCGGNDYMGEYFAGIVDEIKIWDRELSTDEVKALYNSGNLANSRISVPKTETATLTDSGAGSLNLKALSELITLADSRYPILRMNRPETITLTDTKYSKVSTVPIGTITLTDVDADKIIRALSENISMVDSKISKISDDRQETLSLIEIRNALVRLKTLSETMSLTDIVAGLGMFLEVLSEILSLADAEVVTNVRVEISNTLSLLDTRDGKITLHALVEAITLLDTVTKTILYQTLMSEIVSLSDSERDTVLAMISNTINLIDSDGSYLQRPISELMTLIDSKVPMPKVTKRDVISITHQYDKSGLVLDAPMNEGSGSIIYDESGNDNNGLASGTTWVDGIYNTGIKFNGGSDYVTFGHKPSLNFGTGDFAIGFWLGPRTPINTWCFIMSKGGNDGIVISTQADLIRVSMGGWFTDVVDTPGKWELNSASWYHVIIQRLSGTVYCYVDGVLYGTPDVNNYDFSAVIDQDLLLGYGWIEFDGILDELKIWNRALLTQEILNLASMKPGDKATTNVLSPKSEIQELVDSDRSYMQRSASELVTLTDAKQNRLSKTHSETQNLIDSRLLKLLETRSEIITETDSRFLKVYDNKIETASLDDSEENKVFTVPDDVVTLIDSEYAQPNPLVKEKIDLDQGVSKSDLVLDISMNEGSGNKAYDESGNKNHGTITDPVWTSGKYGSAIDFDGDSTYIDCGNSPSITPTTAFTISAWIRVDAWHPTYNAIVVKGNGSQAWNFLIQTSSKKIYTETCLNGSNNTVIGTRVLELGVLYHVVYSFDGTYVRLYIDGENDKTSSPLSGTLGIAGTSLTIGRWVDGTYFWNGMIDEVKMWNRALSTDEVKALYNFGNIAYSKLTTTPDDTVTLVDLDSTHASQARLEVVNLDDIETTVPRKTGTETISLTDSRRSNVRKDVTEITTLTDLHSNKLSKLPSETVSLTDSERVLAYVRPIENLQMVDSKSSSFLKYLLETMTLSDLKSLFGAATVQDTLVSSDGTAVGAYTSLLELLTLYDSYTNQYSRRFTVLEYVTMTDAPNTTVRAIVSNSFVMTDEMLSSIVKYILAQRIAIRALKNSAYLAEIKASTLMESDKKAFVESENRSITTEEKKSIIMSRDKL